MHGGHAEREKPHLPICACTIGDLELIEISATADAAGPEKQCIYLLWPKPPIFAVYRVHDGPSCKPSVTYVSFVLS